MKAIRGVALVAFCIHSSVFANSVFNAWTNPASGDWQDPNWSLGVLPGPGQSIMLTNQGWKAIAIRQSTEQSFPATLNVDSVTVSGNTDSFNVLVLNYAGLNTPLKVLNNCLIGTNGTIANYYSSFEVDGGLRVEAPAAEVPSGGSFTQVGGLTVVNGPFFLRSGMCNATNGNLTLGEVTIGEPRILISDILPKMAAVLPCSV